MGKSQRDKGLRVEREFVNLHRGSGVQAERVPLSGSAGGSYSGDLTVTLPGRKLNVEVKARRDGREWAWVARTLEGHDALYLRQDRCEPLVVIPWAVWETLTRDLSSNHRRIKGLEFDLGFVLHQLDRGLEVRPPLDRPADAGHDLQPGHRNGDDPGPAGAPAGPGDGL